MKSLQADTLMRVLSDCQRPGAPAETFTFYGSTTFDLGEASRRLDAFYEEDPEFREVDEAPKTYPRGKPDVRAVFDPRDQAPSDRYDRAVTAEDNTAKARQIVEAIRGYEDNSATMPRQNLIRLDFSLTDEAAVAMVAELMRPKPHEEWWNEVLTICTDAGMHKEDTPLRWLKEGMPAEYSMLDWLRTELQLGKDHKRSRKADFGHLREIEKVGEEHGFNGHPVEFASWLRATLEDWQRARSELSSLKDSQKFLDELLDVLREEGGWPAGEHAVSWLRRLLSERPSKEAFNATERARIDAIGELRAFKQVHAGTIARLVEERDEARKGLALMRDIANRFDTHSL